MFCCSLFWERKKAKLKVVIFCIHGLHLSFNKKSKERLAWWGGVVWWGVGRILSVESQKRTPKVCSNNTVLIFLNRFVMSNLNISGRRIVEMWEVEEMINAVDDGDGNLSYEEFIQLIQQQNVTGTSANKSGDSEKKWIKTLLCSDFQLGSGLFGLQNFF